MNTYETPRTGRLESGMHFDVIVCGAGSAGSTVAGRLAADTDLNILLLEAGGTDERENVQDRGCGRPTSGRTACGTS